MATCQAPNCPIADLKDTVKSIDVKTDKIISIDTSLQYMSREIETVQKQNQNLFKRVSDLETTRPSKKELYWGIGIVAAVLAVADKILKWVGVLK